jgi:hypothetical protein
MTPFHDVSYLLSKVKIEPKQAMVSNSRKEAGSKERSERNIEKSREKEVGKEGRKEGSKERKKKEF